MPSQLRISELDFNLIKENLKEFLQQQDEFTDFNFEGSNLSVILDILAYNNHYMAYYVNMLLSESFLDSAVKRNSAVSIAKHLGYTPVSVRGSTASVNVKVINPDGLPPKLTIDPFTAFVSTIDGQGYNFLTTKAYTASRDGSEYNFNNVEIKEGQLQEYSYVVSDNTPKAKYEIPALNVDTSTISVVIQKSATDLNRETYILCDDLTKIDNTSKIYFLQQNPLERYEIYFGDNVLGKSPEIGNIVIIRYLVSQGEITNVSSKIEQTFQASSAIQGSNNITVTTNSNSTSGKARETITSIKHYAPKFSSSRNRCVSSSDYEALIHANFSGAESISVWGGEDNSPPVYGKVFVSLKPAEGFIISEETKENIKSNILSSKKGPTILVEFVDPEYIYIGLDISAEYKYAITTKSSGQIYDLLIAAVGNYFTTYLQKFDADYKHSLLISQLIDVDEAVTSVLASITLQKRFIPTLNTTNILNLTNAINFRNPIKPGSFRSTFYNMILNGTQTLVKIIDVPNDNPPNELGQGILKLINADDNSVLNSNIGNINYATGTVNINSIVPVSLPSSAEDIRFTCNIQEKNYNLNANKNEIFVLNNSVKNKITGTDEGLIITVSSIA